MIKTIPDGYFLAVDCSRTQGRIDWKRARKAGVKGVWIKASEGLSQTTERRKYFLDTSSAAADAGLLVGGYHFSRLRDPSLEHAHFREQLALRGFESTLPDVLDIEPRPRERLRINAVDWRRTYSFDADKERLFVCVDSPVSELRAEGKALSNIVHYVSWWSSRAPGDLIYGYASMLDDLAHWPLRTFVASRPWGKSAPPFDARQCLRKEPAIPWQAWQLTSKGGRIPGCDGPIDLVLARTTLALAPLPG